MFTNKIVYGGIKCYNSSRFRGDKKFNDIFSGIQPLQDVKVLSTFRELTAHSRTHSNQFGFTKLVFLNRRALASIIPGRERFSWNLSF